MSSQTFFSQGPLISDPWRDRWSRRCCFADLVANTTALIFAKKTAAMSFGRRRRWNFCGFASSLSPPPMQAAMAPLACSGSICRPRYLFGLSPFLAHFFVPPGLSERRRVGRKSTVPLQQGKRHCSKCQLHRCAKKTVVGLPQFSFPFLHGFPLFFFPFNAFENVESFFLQSEIDSPTC